MTKVRRFTVLGAIAAALCAFNVATVSAKPASNSSGCVDHADNGKGNLGDPGDGGNHHNESNGVGNIGDPGNGQGHLCASDD